MKYLLSIVIPTRNRKYYAINTIKQILNVTDENVQIIVSDNSDNGSLKENIRLIDSDRIKYEYIEKRIPGVDNYANGISMCDGEYICCIGDDDGILKEIQHVVQWASINDVKAINLEFKRLIFGLIQLNYIRQEV